MALNVSYSVNRNHDLWQDLKDGNRNALDKIYYENVASMLLYGMQFTRDNALIDDCIQELFIDLWVKRDRLGPTDSIRFYLMKSLKRRILRSLKRAAKHDYFADMDELLMANGVIDCSSIRTWRPNQK